MQEARAPHQILPLLSSSRAQWRPARCTPGRPPSAHGSSGGGTRGAGSHAWLVGGAPTAPAAAAGFAAAVANALRHSNCLRTQHTRSLRRQSRLPRHPREKRKMHLDIAAFNRSEPLVTPLPMSLPPRVKFEDEDSAAAPVRPAQPVDLTGERLPPQVPPRRLCPSSRFWLVATTLLLSTFWQVMCAVAAPAVIDSIWGGVSLQVWHYIRLVLDRAGSARGGRVCR